MKEQLRDCVLAIGKEEFDAVSANEVTSVCSRIYACMLDEMHLWLQQATGQSGTRQDVGGGSATQMLSLATECEMMHENKRAMTLHEERWNSKC